MSRFETLIRKLNKLTRTAGALTLGTFLAVPGYAQDFGNHSQPADPPASSQAGDDSQSDDEGGSDSGTPAMVTQLQETLQNPGTLTLDQIAQFFEQRGLPSDTVQKEIVNSLAKALRAALQNPGDLTEEQIIAYFQKLGLDRSIIDQVVADFHANSSAANAPSQSSPPASSDNADSSTDNSAAPAPSSGDAVVDDNSGSGSTSGGGNGTSGGGSGTSAQYYPPIQLPGPTWQDHSPDGSGVPPAGYDASTSNASSNGGSANGASPAGNATQPGVANPPQLGSTPRTSSGPVVSPYGYRNNDGTTSWWINGKQVRLPNGADPNAYAGNGRSNSQNGSGNNASSANGNSQVNGNSQAGSQYGPNGNNLLNPPGGRVNKTYNGNGGTGTIGQYGPNGNNLLNPPGGRVNKTYNGNGGTGTIGQYGPNGNNLLNPPGGRVNKTYNGNGGTGTIGQYGPNGNNQLYPRPRITPTPYKQFVDDGRGGNGAQGPATRRNELVAVPQRRAIAGDSGRVNAASPVNHAYSSHPNTVRSESNAPEVSARRSVSPVAYVQPSSNGSTSPTVAQRQARGIIEHGSSSTAPAPQVMPSMPSVTPGTGRSSDRAALDFD